jgi:nucleotide-binding universal stress UspA family protein
MGSRRPELVPAAKELLMLPIHTIVHPTDFSPRSDHAFQLACSLARDHGARLIVCHVVLPPAVVYGAEITGLSEESYKQAAEEKLAQLAAPDPALRLEKRLLQGEPADEIVRLAGASNCDLIVLGTHGRTGLSRLLLGSVAEQVLRKAPCAVLTVKAPFGETESAAPASTQGV